MDSGSGSIKLELLIFQFQITKSSMNVLRLIGLTPSPAGNGGWSAPKVRAVGMRRMPLAAVESVWAAAIGVFGSDYSIPKA
jgi:hypothetical protein